MNDAVTKSSAILALSTRSYLELRLPDEDERGDERCDWKGRWM